MNPLFDPPDEPCACDTCDKSGECAWEITGDLHCCPRANGQDKRDADVEAALDAAERERG